MKLTHALLGEHGAFYVMFERLEEIAETATDPGTMKDALSPIAAALVAHSVSENDLLFPALEAARGAGGPIEVMRGEHIEVEKLIADVTACASMPELRGALAALLQVTRTHFAKEEEVLFPMAERSVPSATLDQLAKDWAERRGVKLV